MHPELNKRDGQKDTVLSNDYLPPLFQTLARMTSSSRKPSLTGRLGLVLLLRLPQPRWALLPIPDQTALGCPCLVTGLSLPLDYEPREGRARVILSHC